MKKLWMVCGVLFLISVLSLKSQNQTITVKPIGYASYELILDTYKSTDSRDGELYLYPVRRVLDNEGKDINSRTYLQMLAVQARIGFAITGPDLGSAKSTALIEADFYGTADSYVNLLRLRHAWFKLAWEKTELVLGQASHPTIIAECTPSPLSFGSGVPYHTLNRSVQARLNYKILPNVKFSLAAVMASTHFSSGPANQRDIQRKSGLPEIQVQMQLGSTEKFLAGFTAGYKFLSLLDTTKLGYKTTQRIGSYNLQGFARLTLTKMLVKAQFNYGTNLTNLTFIGGYGMKAGSADPVTGEYEYTNLKSLTSWVDLETKFPKYNIGAFCGYSENLGAEDDIDVSVFYNRNADISSIFRIAPRFFIKNNNLVYGLEWGLNGAVYATAYDSKRKATKTDDLVFNNRILIMVKYNF